jgi:hypothetical protein
MNLRAFLYHEYLIYIFFETILDAGCNIKKDCDSNAACYLDEISMTHYCRCKDGFSGDGYSCKADVIGCNIIDNCSKFAKCLFDQQEGGYRCKCDSNRVSSFRNCLNELRRIFITFAVSHTKKPQTKCPEMFCFNVTMLHSLSLIKGQDRG